MLAKRQLYVPTRVTHVAGTVGIVITLRVIVRHDGEVKGDENSVTAVMFDQGLPVIFVKSTDWAESVEAPQ